MLGRSLPQLLTQLGCWLHAEHDAGRVGSDNQADPGPAVCRATAQLADAGDVANELAHALDRAQQHLAHLGAAPTGRVT